MKAKLIFFSFSLVVTTFLLLSCLSSQSKDQSNDIFTISKSSFNFEIKVKWLEDQTYELVEGTNQTITTYLNQEFSSSELESVSNIEILPYFTTDEQFITIAAIGADRDGNSVPIAKVFGASGENPSPQSRHFGPGGGGTDKHKCTGNPCSCCKFIKETTPNDALFGPAVFTKIIGCECDTGGKCGNGERCNHELSGG